MGKEQGNRAEQRRWGGEEVGRRGVERGGDGEGGNREERGWEGEEMGRGDTH